MNALYDLPVKHKVSFCKKIIEYNGQCYKAILSLGFEHAKERSNFCNILCPLLLRTPINVDVKNIDFCHSAANVYRATVLLKDLCNKHPDIALEVLL